MVLHWLDFFMFSIVASLFGKSKLERMIALDDIESCEKEATINALACIGMSKQGVLLHHSSLVF